MPLLAAHGQPGREEGRRAARPGKTGALLAAETPAGGVGGHPALPAGTMPASKCGWGGGGRCLSPRIIPGELELELGPADRPRRMPGAGRGDRTDPLGVGDKLHRFLPPPPPPQPSHRLTKALHHHPCVCQQDKIRPGPLCLGVPCPPPPRSGKVTCSGLGVGGTPGGTPCLGTPSPPSELTASLLLRLGADGCGAWSVQGGREAAAAGQKWTWRGACLRPEGPLGPAAPAIKPTKGLAAALSTCRLENL